MYKPTQSPELWPVLKANSGIHRGKKKVWKLWSHLLKQLQLYGAETQYISFRGEAFLKKLFSIITMWNNLPEG